MIYISLGVVKKCYVITPRDMLSTTNVSGDLFTSGNMFLKTTFPAGNYYKIP